MSRIQQPQFYLPLTRVVKALIIIHLSVWIVFQIIFDQYLGFEIGKWLSLTPGKVLFDYAYWQMFTYMFLHSMSVSHIVFNLLTLWLIGSELEQHWGRKFFLNYYLLTGVGAAIIYVSATGIYSFMTGKQLPLVVPVVGASGAIFGLLLAYGMLFGERTLHFMMLFPMKAKHFVLLLGAIEIFSLMTSGVMGSEVAYLAHLGGLASGYLILKFWQRWQRQGWGRKPKARGSNLRLVVNNEKTDKNPRYWN